MQDIEPKVLDMEQNLDNQEVIEEEVDNPEEKNDTFTKEEVMRMIQAESDRRVNQALAKQKKSYEKKLSLSNLDENERAKKEKEMRIEELEQQLAEFRIEKNKSELKSVLSSRGLSAEFADVIRVSDDLEESQANIDTLDRLFKEAVKAEVQKRLAESGSTPKGNVGNAPKYDKESAKKMSLSEMSKLAQSNPELYSKLFG